MIDPRICRVCGKDTHGDSSRCTNRLCGECHARYCTGGGSDSPGHNLNLIHARRAHAARKPSLEESTS